MRLDEVSSTLSALEIEDLVTVRDVAVVAQRLEMVTRIAREIEDYVLELGTDGRLLSLQLEELVTGVDAERELVIRDYVPSGRAAASPERPAARLEALSPTDLVDPASIARVLGLGSDEHLDGAVAPRGYRLLAKVPRLPTAGRRPAGRALRHPAEAALRRRRGPPGRRRRRRAARPLACARACPGWPSRRSSSATSRRCYVDGRGGCAARRRTAGFASSSAAGSSSARSGCDRLGDDGSGGVSQLERRRRSGSPPRARPRHVVGAREHPARVAAGSPRRTAGRSRPR